MVAKEYTPHDGSVPFHPAPASRHTLTALPFKVYPVSHVYETEKRSTDTTADPKSGVTGILQTVMKYMYIRCWLIRRLRKILLNFQNMITELNKLATTYQPLY